MPITTKANQLIMKLKSLNLSKQDCRAAHVMMHYLPTVAAFVSVIHS